jgi:hypothetical protein
VVMGIDDGERIGFGHGSELAQVVGSQGSGQ